MSNKLHFIIYAFLVTAVIASAICNAYKSDQLEKAEAEKSYMQLEISAHVETLKAIQARRAAEDSLRNLKSPQYEENLRLIRSATDADLKRLIESAADTTRFRLLFP
jgi:hypothetical protein